MPAELLKKIVASPNLPSMPAVALKVLELTQKEDVSAGEIAAVIQNDPALSAKLLQTANSPMFGLAKKVSSLQQATVVLGLRTVKVMALSFSLVESFRDSEGTAFDYRKYWQRSLTNAVISKSLAQRCKDVRVDECFVGGLLVDLGMLAAFRCVPELYEPVLAEYVAQPRPLQEIEAEKLGLTHARITEELLRQWSLPDMLCEAVGGHHCPVKEGVGARTAQLMGLLYAASSLSELFCGDVSNDRLDEIKDRCCQEVPVSPEDLETALDEVHTNVKETANLFSLDIGDSISYETLRSQAMTQLATLSLSAEMDRAAAANRARQVQEDLEKLSETAATDALTQIANRRAFDEALEETLTPGPKKNAGVGLLMMDIDHFKKLNDTYGHQAGDEALRRVGQCLKSVSSDAVSVARYGGEEFTVILAGATTRKLRELGEEIRQAIEKIEFEHGGQPISFTASLGGAYINLKLESVTPKQVIERADECLYDAKHGGRNRLELAF